MDRLSEIRARFEEAKADNARGYMIPTEDVEYLLAEIERLKQANRIAAAAWDNSALNFSEAQMERWKARAEKAEAELCKCCHAFSDATGHGWDENCEVCKFRTITEPPKGE